MWVGSFAGFQPLEHCYDLAGPCCLGLLEVEVDIVGVGTFLVTTWILLVGRQLVCDTFPVLTMLSEVKEQE